jgi:nucleotide-binding universal stress UspA family protein
MKTIIVAVDFSRESDNSLRYAAGLAKKMGGRIVLFNSFNLPIHIANSYLPASSLKHLEDENKKLLKEKCEWLCNTFTVEAIYESGFLLEVVDELEKLFRKYAADLIIMGMASESVAQDLFGNTTTSAIMKLSFPVLAVPEGAEFTGMNNILFAYDGIEMKQDIIPKKIKEIAQSFEANVEVFHVKKPTEASVPAEVLGEDLKGEKYVYKEVESRDIIKEIETEMKQINADMLIMVPRKYGFWESLIHRSKTRVMASGSDVPVLSLPVSE